MKDKNNLFRDASKSKSKWKKLFVIMPITLAMVITGFSVYQSGFSHEVKLNGETVGYIKDEDNAGESLDNVKKFVHNKHGDEAYFEDKIELEKVRGHNEDVVELNELDNNMYDNIDILKPASIILVDEKEEIVVETKKEAESVLHEIKDFYERDEDEEEDIEVSKTYFKQDVEIIDKDVDVNEILSEKEVLTALGLEDSEIREDRIARGNSALNVSRSFRSRTKRGEEDSKKDVLESLVEVVSVEKHTDTEEIDFQVEEEKDSSIYKGEKEVKQTGKKGKKEIITEVTYINGKEKEKEKVEENVIKEPKNKIVLVGTKERPAPVAERSSTEEDSNQGNSTGGNSNQGSSTEGNSTQISSTQGSSSRDGSRNSSKGASNERSSEGSSNNKSTSAPTYNGSTGANIVATAKGYLGTPYVSGGSSPSGFDCSGFTSYVYKQYGITIPRSSGGQGSHGAYVSKSQLKPGDIVAFPGHVGIYIGGGSMIHSPRPGKNVEITSINNSYFKNRFISGRRPY